MTRRTPSRSTCAIPDNFTYSTNISDLACASLTTVDCFATFKKGFCEQYATTMTMLMRMEGYPARYVEGYLSGPFDKATNTVEVTGQQRHAWVEVYFPGFGWIPFDPTGGSVGQPTELPVGSAITASPTPSPSPSSSGGTGVQDVTPRHGGAGGSTSPGSTDNGGSSLTLLTAVIVLVVLLGLLVVWRRRPRRLESPDTVYRGIVRAASRLGYRPLPTQTVYEYTGMLADLVPRARDPLGEVATAQVEVVYGRQAPADRPAHLPGRGPASGSPGPAAARLPHPGSRSQATAEGPSQAWLRSSAGAGIRAAPWRGR